MEEFEVKIINYEHITRRRFVKQKKVTGSGSKIVKLLDVFPEVIFSSGSSHRIKEFPGASLFCFSTRKDMRNVGPSKGLQDIHTKYEDAALEISASLPLSRNILLALLCLQSWKPFMQRWLRSSIMVLESKAHSTVLVKALKAASGILKILTRLAEAAIPRSAENIALAIGAFCMVLPASAYAVQTMASKFLLNWLSQYEHEYRQWSAAISVGLISSCLHVTDHEQKFKNINALLEVACVSKCTLVIGACGIGLGFSCQDLLTRVDSGATTQSKKETFRMQETELLRKIIRTLIQMIYQFGGSSDGILEKLEVCFPLGTDNSSSRGVEFLTEDMDLLQEEDFWGAAGPIIGLGNSLGAIYRAGLHELVFFIKSLIISWIPSANIFSLKHSAGETCLPMFALGACLALPTVVSFCLRVELIDNIELDNIMSGFMKLISDLLSADQSDTFHQNLLMASCVGAGTLLSIISNSRLLSLEEENIKGFLELCRRTYSSPHPPFVHLGGMLGVVNALGACCGMLIQQIHFPSSSSAIFNQKEPSPVLSSLSPNHILEAESTSMIQEIFLVAQDSNDPQSQNYAAWAVSFLRHSVFTGGRVNEETGGHNDSGAPKVLSQGFSEDTVVMKLSMWLTQINYSELGSSISIKNLAFALRCLSQAPRLPSLDWVPVVSQFMKYGHQVSDCPPQDITLRRGTLREECFLFLLSHANQVESLLGFLDELTDISRLKTLESNLLSLVLLKLADLLKSFSTSRVVKLFDDVVDLLHWFYSSDKYNHEHQIWMRISCWKGLQTCLTESTALETQDYLYNLERCMEVLFTMLPWSHSSVTVELYQKNSNKEWDEAIKCLGKARQGWLSNFLLIPDTNFKDERYQTFETLKKAKAKAALVRMGSIPLVELAKLKVFMLHTDSEVIWNILVDVALTLLHYDESVRRQWLADTVEILCVTSYPSTALRFLGLLSGSCCKYMPILAADKLSVLSDLPMTLSSLLEDSRWGLVAESVASCLVKATERIHDWVTHVENGDYLPNSQPVDETENEMALFLLQVMHLTCVSLKEHLPVDKLLRLASMVVAWLC